MTDAASEELTHFLNYIWGDEAPIAGQPTFIYVPTLDDQGKWTKTMFEWPRQRAAIVRFMLLRSATGLNVFYSPALYKKSPPIKENVLGSRFFWVDFDGNAPLRWDDLDIGVSIPRPSLIIQSSLPTHQHCYWELDEFITDLELLEDRNRSLAYILHADTSGWDADQVLRPLGTMNYKRGLPVRVYEES